MQTTLAALVPASVAAAILRQLGARRHVRARAFLARRPAAPVAGAHRVAAARSPARAATPTRRPRRAASPLDRDRSGDDGVARVPGTVRASARCSTSTAASAGSISSGPGRAGSSPGGRWPAFDSAAATVLRSHGCTGPSSSGDSSRPTRSSRTASARSSATSWRSCGRPARSTCARRASGWTPPSPTPR